MKKLLLSLSLIISAAAFAQQSTSLVLVDGKIANAEFMTANKSNIKTVKNYKAGVALPSALSSFSDALPSGIVAVSLKEQNYDFISLAELNEQNKLASNSPVMVDGRVFKNTDVKIIGYVLNSIETVIVDGNKVLSISSKLK